MKPITEDVVFSILQGLEKRERRKTPVQDAKTAALHEKILKEYLEKMNDFDQESTQSINWVTHQKCKDMFILSKVG